MALRIQVDPKIARFGERLRAAARVGLFRVAELTEQALSEEVPVVTSNLRQGITSDVDPDALTATVNVSARSGRASAQSAQLIRGDGTTVSIPLRARPAFDYAEAVARGTGIFGPQGAPIRPKSAKVLLVPGSPKLDAKGRRESYVLGAGGVTYVFRRSVKGVRPNPYDERALARVRPQVAGVFDDALSLANS
jgi:hypothetical protein